MGFCFYCFIFASDGTSWGSHFPGYWSGWFWHFRRAFGISFGTLVCFSDDFFLHTFGLTMIFYGLLEDPLKQRASSSSLVPGHIPGTSNGEGLLSDLRLGCHRKQRAKPRAWEALDKFFSPARWGWGSFDFKKGGLRTGNKHAWCTEARNSSAASGLCHLGTDLHLDMSEEMSQQMSEDIKIKCQKECYNIHATRYVRRHAKKIQKECQHTCHEDMSEMSRLGSLCLM